MAGQRRRHVCVAFHKTAVIGAEADEAAEVHVGSWKRPIMYLGNLVLIDRLALAGDPVACETQLPASELVLLDLDVELLLAKDSEDIAHVVDASLQRRAVAE